MAKPVPAFWSPRIGALEPYVPGEQPRIANLVKLNTNENPYPPSPRTIDAIQRAAEAGLERYPDPESTVLRHCSPTGWREAPCHTGKSWSVEKTPG